MGEKYKGFENISERERGIMGGKRLDKKRLEELREGGGKEFKEELL